MCFEAFVPVGGLSCEKTDLNSVSVVGLHGNDSPQGFSGIDSRERNLVISDEESKFDEKMTSSNYGGSSCLLQSGFEPKSLAREQPLETGTIGRLVPSVNDDEQVSSLQSDGTPVDVISDNEESCRSGFMSTASDHVENEDYSSSPHSNCLSTGLTEKSEDYLTVACTLDYVIYQNTLHGEAELLFFPASILVKCSDLSRDNDDLVLQCAIADIIRIDCQWSASIGATLVKFHF